MISQSSSASRRIAFTWSLESFVLPSNLFLLVYVLFHGSRRYKRTNISYYLVLSLLALARLVDVAINTYASYLSLAKANPHYMLQAVAEFAAGAGFTVLNMTRLFRLAPCRAWSPKLVYSLTVGTAASVAMYLAVTCLTVYLYFVGEMGEDSPAYRFSNEVFSVWSIYDAVLNAGISFAFVWWLRSLAGGGRSSKAAEDAKAAEAATVATGNAGGGFTAPNVRPELLILLTEIKWLLATECTLAISATTMQLVAPDLDPLWSVNLTVEAFRLFVFINFLIRLNKVMRAKQIHSGSKDPCTDFLPFDSDPSNHGTLAFPSFFGKSSLPIFTPNTFPISATNGTPCSSASTCTCSLKSRLLRMLRSPLHSSTHPDMQSLITRPAQPHPHSARRSETTRASPPPPAGVDNGSYVLTPVASNMPISLGWDTLGMSGGLSRHNSVRSPMHSQHGHVGPRLGAGGAPGLGQSPRQSWLVATVAAARDRDSQIQQHPIEMMGSAHRLPTQRNHPGRAFASSLVPTGEGNISSSTQVGSSLGGANVAA